MITVFAQDMLPFVIGLVKFLQLLNVVAVLLQDKKIILLMYFKNIFYLKYKKIIKINN